MKNIKKKEQLQKENLSKMVKDKNFALGLGIFIFLLVVLGLGTIRVVRSLNQNKFTIKNPVALQSNEAEVTQASQAAMVANTVNAEKKEATTSPKLAIKTLPNTQGDTYYTVMANENFWKISKKMCGTGLYYLAIKQRNGYQHKTLRPGDSINIICSK